MAKRTKFAPKSTPDGWRVNIPEKFSLSGKRERHFYKSRDEALEAAVKLREQRDSFGEQAKAISPSLTEQAHQANQILLPWGKTLVEAAEFFRKSLENDKASVSLETAAAGWLASCEGELRDTTIKSYRYTADRLKVALAGVVMSSITGEQVEAALKTKGGTSYDLHRRNARVLWSWAEKPPRKWCDAAIFTEVTSPRKKSTGEISVFKPAEARALLATAETYYPQTVCIYAVALFAGIRAEEIQRLDAGHFNEDGIEVPAAVAKKNRRRHIAMNATLLSWLQAYPFTPLANWREVDCAVRRLAGWNVAARLLENPPKPTRGPWPQNVLRHTHASAAMANGATLEHLLFSIGHSNGPEMLKRHYVGRYSKKEAAEFWSIGPKGSVIGAAGAPTKTEAATATAATPSILPKNIEMALPAENKVKWPTKAKLAKLVMLKPMTHLAKDLGVSDVAIRKHCVKAGIELPPPGYWQRQRV